MAGDKKMFAYRWTVLGDEAEEVEESHDVTVFAVWDDGDEGHDVVLDRVGVDGVDLRQDARQRVVAGYDGVDDGLNIRKTWHWQFDWHGDIYAELLSQELGGVLRL